MLEPARQPDGVAPKKASGSRVRDARYRRRVPRPLLTVGYGNRELDDVLALLRAHRVRYLIDVRSSPCSRFNPAFSKGHRAVAVEKAGIHYDFMGDAPGGRPDDESCYDGAGHVDYLACREHADFKRGFERLRSAFEQNAGAAIFCSELRPEHCHRTKLIAEAMTELGVPAGHIDADGSLTGHRAVMERLGDAQMSLLAGASEATRSRRAIAAF